MKKPILYVLSLTIIIAFAIYSIAQSSENDEYHQACCISADGFCRDILVRAGDTSCGEGREGYSLLSTEKNCILVEECCHDIDCQEGDCYIRGKKQPDKKQYYICAALCKETGECSCNGGLDNCQGDWNWEFNPN